MSEIKLMQDFAAPAERVFEAVADQERMSAWLGTKVSVPVRGEHGLVGTVRRIHVGLASLDERIIECEPPKFIAYQVVTPLPLLRRHRGEMHVEPLGEQRARLTWRIALELTPAFVGDLVRVPLELMLGRALKRFARSLERTP